MAMQWRATPDEAELPETSGDDECKAMESVIRAQEDRATRICPRFCICDRLYTASESVCFMHAAC
ncbi:hypothetical protein BAUCODRAFT_33930 [Baudoinia panamericana UAMH 10762]|uniref:Uncharacterized protein n=1 Tax=Baudoinia panamericana (strain UAMH 10762) TaxID=717646 RepID=M2LQ86_BAUPA|nr:uncharacterized protein BAUCODRAFT_33930 [Baudoinia panamericana UAMH 10762]EMC96567.1 hypothetical protein BAUCODRAFT_33930 [Baudoinia panamericana UAMH 10762]